MTTTTHTAPASSALDTALASLVREARAAIRNCEQDCAEFGLQDFNEQLARLSYPKRVKLCRWWIAFCKEHRHD